MNNLIVENNRFIKKLFNDISCNITIENLKPFSKIRLRKSRNKKKFLKYYYRYVSEKIYTEYQGCLVMQLVYKTAAQTTGLDLTIEPGQFTEENPQYLREKKLNRILEIDEEPISPKFIKKKLPKIELTYIDFKYEEPK